MKILITNIVTLNAGDAAILYATMDVLRDAFGDDTQFVVYDKHGALPGRYYPDVEFRKLLYLTRQDRASERANRLFRAIDSVRFKAGLWTTKYCVPLIPWALLAGTEHRDLLEYQTADLIVSSGGTYLVESYSLDARIFDYRLSLFLDRPLVFFTQSLGPFANESNRQALLPIFEKSVVILVRDEQSRQNLVDLGVKDTPVHVAADAAFAMSDAAALECAKAEARPLHNPLRVAISVREWRHFKTVKEQQGMERYRAALQALTCHLVETHKAEITFISTCQGMPEYWTDDSKLARAIADALPADIRAAVSVNSDFHAPAVLAELLKEYDLVIATRMHMAILALGVGTPVVPVAYEFKMRELFERLGQGEWVNDIETISPETLIERVDRFLEQLPSIRGPLFSAVQNERENAIASGQLVKEAFERWRANRRSRNQ